MSRISERTTFFGTAYLHGAGGSEKPFAFKGSYSKPRRDRQGCIRFGWTATVVGVDRQPQPRTTILDNAADEAGSEVGSEVVEGRIRRSIEEHLSFFALSATR